MEWYMWVFLGIIIGGIIFNAKMRRGFFRLVESFWRKGSGEDNFICQRGKGIKKYRLVEDEDEND